MKIEEKDKIWQSVLIKCGWGEDNIPLNIENLITFTAFLITKIELTIINYKGTFTPYVSVRAETSNNHSTCFDNLDTQENIINTALKAVNKVIGD